MAPGIATNGPGSSPGAAIRDAILAGVIALGIFGPLVGLKTEQNMQNELIITTRWGTVAIIVAIAATVKLLP